MSTSPSWIPKLPEEQESLPYDIKYPLARKYFDHDGSLGGRVALDSTDLPYLEGLRDGGSPEISKGAEILIRSLNEFEKIIFIVE